MKKILFVGMVFLAIFLFPQKSLAATENELTVENFTLLIRKDANSVAEPLGNVKVNIYGVNSETSEQFLLNTTTSDTNGTVSMKKTSAPKKIDKVHFQYYYGIDGRGYIVSLKNTKYSANHTREIPTNRTINTTRVSSFSGANGTPEFYTELTKLNNIYDSVYKKQLAAIKAATSYINSKNTSIKSRDIIYDLNLIQDGNSFNRYGKSSVEGPVICINTKASSDWNLDKTCAVVHEWAHSNMYEINKLPGSPYESHYSHNKDQETSYKEGWAIFQRHQYTCGLKNEFPNDVQVQSDERLYGISTNFTVKGALYDIYDINYDKYSSIEDDPFDIYTLFVNGNHTMEEKDLISEGIMHTLMVDSGAKTFKEFYQYLVTNYVDKHPDKTMKEKLVRAMAVNGIDKNGDFIVKK